MGQVNARGATGSERSVGLEKKFGPAAEFDGRRHGICSILLVEVMLVYELKYLKASLASQRRRLKQLEEISGGPDPNHPLQAFSIRRIAWLENEIRKHEERAAQQ